MAKAGGNLLNTYVADYVVFDLETTGISPKTDEVVEISAVKVEHGKVTDEFSTLVNPKQRIPYGASRVNGITDDMVAEAPFFEQVLEEFLEFIEGFVLVGHNIARFDMMWKSILNGRCQMIILIHCRWREGSFRIWSITG